MAQVPAWWTPVSPSRVTLGTRRSGCGPTPSCTPPVASTSGPASGWWRRARSIASARTRCSRPGSWTWSDRQSTSGCAPHYSRPAPAIALFPARCRSEPTGAHMADQEAHADRRSAPRTVLHTRDGVVLVVGLVLGAGIFRAPQLVAGGSSSGAMFLALWVVGGVVSLLGALCYAELAAAYPNAGGEYHFLSRAFGQRAGFLCAWSRMTVIQTGSIALLSFLVGDYVATQLGDGEPSAHISAVVAAAVVVGLTLINVAGLRQSGG